MHGWGGLRLVGRPVKLGAHVSGFSGYPTTVLCFQSKGSRKAVAIQDERFKMRVKLLFQV